MQGKIAAQGTPEALMKSGIDFVSKVEDSSVSQSKKFGHGRRMSDHSSRKSSICSVYSRRSSMVESIYGESAYGEDDENTQSDFLSQLEKISKNKTNGSVLMSYLKAGANWSTLLLLWISFVATQVFASAADIWISMWFVFIA